VRLPSDRAMSKTATRPLARTLLLAALGTCAGLLLTELGVRIATHSLLTWRGKESDGYVITDRLVGRIPRDGISLRHPQGFSMTIADHGTRDNGRHPAPADRPLTLVVGDSFAFGDGVNDEDSWPAILERLLGRRVINAAVPGFGLDQAVLRAEQLAEIYAPDIVILSFIPHDVLRCEMSYWSGHAKPYFQVDSSGLRLHPAPVPPRRPYALLKQVLSASMTLDILFARSLHWEGPEQTLVHQRGREVACLLVKQLAMVGRARHTQIIVLAQPQQPAATPEQLEIKNGVLACAQANHLSVLDLFPVIESLPPAQRTPLFPRHMSAEGNRLVATEVADFIQRAILSDGRADDIRGAAQQ